jgi:acetyl esterase/lipase
MLSTGLTSGMQHGEVPQFIPLYPENRKPNINGTTVIDSMSDGHICSVNTPGIFKFLVPAEENKGTAILICPGGSYERLHHISNGFEYATWFNQQGINAFVLIYRLPHQKDLNDRDKAPLQDAQRAMKIIRANASAWSVSSRKVGVMGVSAGGHVASSLITHPLDISVIHDGLDTFSFKANFSILLSPVITMGKYAHTPSKKNFLGPNHTKEQEHKYSNELHVDHTTPPTFIVHAQDDSKVTVKNSLLFYNALIDSKVSASIHVFPKGDHEIQLKNNPGSAALWLELLTLWLRENKFLTS